jgi:dTDP-4-dehydrorhamnose reductase
MVRDLAAGREHHHPVLESPGWWRRRGAAQGPPLVVTGATGTLGRAVGHACDGRGLAYRLLRRDELEIADAASVARALDEHRPWAVVNTAGYVRVDEAEEDAARCFRENRDGARVLAEACAQRGLPFVTFSSDLVFDGRHDVPYVEGDAAAPLNVYGRSKAEAERLVLEAWPAALVVRTSAFFGPWDRWNFLTLALDRMAAGEVVEADGESIVSPTYVPDLVRSSLDLLIDGERGVWHLANAGETTWAGLARLGAEATGARARVRPLRLRCRPCARATAPWGAPAPCCSRSWRTP